MEIVAYCSKLINFVILCIRKSMIVVLESCLFLFLFVSEFVSFEN